ncbi:MAG: alpha-E domain-containing protein [Acidobacteriota bacterium]
MLSRVADSLYWMSRYFERADNCARVIDATHSLMLSRAVVEKDERWFRALKCMGMPPDASGEDPDVAIGRLAVDADNRASMVACVAAARDNASQVREEISSEMWEQLNRLYHEILSAEVEVRDTVAVMRLVAAVREGSYSFYGVTETTMSHGEGWRFVQLGKFTERACAVSLLLDAYFASSGQADDLDWVALLASCAAFDSYCKVFTADLQPNRIATFLLVHPEFPYSVRYSIERMQDSLDAIIAQSPTRQRTRIERVIGRLRASLTFTPVTELLAGDLHAFLHGVLEQNRELHAAVHEAYIDYPIEVAFQN